MDFELEREDEGWAKEFRDDVRTSAERPPHFWAAQRAGIQGRISGKRRNVPFRFAFASVLGLFLIAFAMVMTEKPVIQAPVVAQKPAVSDQQLLADIDETLTNPMPEALAPADLISQDMDRSLKASGKKETR